MITRSRAGSLRPKTFLDYQLFHSKYPLISHHTILQEIEPTCYSKDVSDPRWKEAIKLEFDALISNSTWSLCSRPRYHKYHSQQVGI
jgi:hypothetical protein